jgi:hypothetical protein
LPAGRFRSACLLGTNPTCGPTRNTDVTLVPSAAAGGGRRGFTDRVHRLLYEFRVLQQVKAVAADDLALDRHRLDRVGHQLGIHRLVVADQPVRLAVLGFKAHRQPGVHGDLRAVGVRGTAVGVTDQVNDLAFDRGVVFTGGGLLGCNGLGFADSGFAAGSSFAGPTFTGSITSSASPKTRASTRCH